MSSHFHLLRITATDRAGVITSVSAALATRGVNIDCFAAMGFAGEREGRHGNFIVIIEADAKYAEVLAGVLRCLEVVREVEPPTSLDEPSLARWRGRFSALSTEGAQSRLDP